jgi:murein DD-endopeptidase MepM/ murein hydrolase activator NlpD
MGQHIRRTNWIGGIAFVFFAVFTFSHGEVFAATESDLRNKITENSQKIEELQKQIDQYSSLLNSTSKEATTLKNALAQLELTQKKLETNLRLTSTQITKTSLTLEELAEDIDIAEERIESSSEAISQSMRSMHMAEDANVLEELLKNKSISETWDYVNALHTIGGRIKIELEDLKDLRKLLEAKKEEALGERTKLVSYRKSLADQSKVVVSNKEQKDKLLKDTQNKESTYKAILAEKKEQKESFEKELMEYESQLKIFIDPNSIPGARSGLLAWPFERKYMDNCDTFVKSLRNSSCVTQYFGYTAAAAKLYKTTQKHNGIDFRAPSGTKILAALSGTIVDTEAVNHKSGCQYGKWVLIRHANGLTTIYGHLSHVSVSPGDVVVTGDPLGYSGETGYAYGPHLHFGVYASSGIKIIPDTGAPRPEGLGNASCKRIKTVSATAAAYLDPIIYLPKL